MAGFLLTGATGLLGRPLLDALVARGEEVRVLALEETVDQIQHDGVEVVAGRLQDADAVAEATAGVDVVLHLAGALPGAEADVLEEVNVRGTQALLAASAGSVRRFVFTSSVSVYRPAPWPFMWPIGEDSPQRAHGNEGLRRYGQSKIDAEAAVRAWQAEHGRECVILRPPVVYGVGAPFVERLLEQVVRHPRAAMAQGGRLGVMQWIHARDMAEAVLLAGTRPGAANRAFNVAGAELITMASLRALVHELLTGGDGLPARLGGGTPHYALRFDISSAQEVLGFSPQVRLRDGIAEMLEAMELPRAWARGPRRPQRRALRRPMVGMR